MEYGEEEYITVSHVLEYLFCPRFTFYEYVLGIPEHQEKRYKVIKGRTIHSERETINKKYLRRKLGVVNKEFSVPIYSPSLQVKGIIDEVLTLEDDTMAPLDYKFAEYRDKAFQTHQVQLILYAMLIEYLYHKPVKRGFLCYSRSNYRIDVLDIKSESKEKVKQIIRNVYEIINYGYFPKPTRNRIACGDCCYRNLC